MKIKKFLTACLMGCVLVIGSVNASNAAPDFVLRSVDNGNIRLSEYYGDVVLLNFWATWCGPCRQELPILNNIHNKFKRAGFTVLAVNVDDASVDVPSYLQDFDLNYPVLLDKAHQVVKQYDIRAMPGTVFLSRDGEVRHVHLGYKDGDEAKYAQVIEALLKE